MILELTSRHKNLHVNKSLPNLIEADISKVNETQTQTRNVFTKKWSLTDYKSEDFKKSLEYQQNWYLKLYGFKTETALAS